MERKLASIQRISEISPIEGADRIERAQVLGWYCVVKKGEFQVGDFCIYVEIDSLVPKAIWSEFLWKEGDTKEKYRLKTVKMKGQVSQGLILPTSVLEYCKPEIAQLPTPFEVQEGLDVTEWLHIEKYVPNIPAQLMGLIKGEFPNFIPKTDEPRLQTIPEILDEGEGYEIYVTEKLDGTSFTCYYHLGVFGVCSRNMELCESEGNTYWTIAKKYDIEKKLREVGRSLAIQGEIYGQGIQGNKYALEDTQLAVFNVYDIIERTYLSLYEMEELLTQLELSLVPIVSRGISLSGTVNEWVDIVSRFMSTKNKNIPAEGYVVRGMEKKYVNGDRFSFKVINPNFLLKYGE